MAHRTVRSKIMFQVGKAADATDRVIDHLAAAAEVAQGQHPRLNDMLPVFVQNIKDLKTALERFRLEI